MPDIKTRDIAKGTIKTIDKSAVAAERILRTKPLPTITVSGKRRVEKECFEKWYSAQSHYKKVSERSEPDV